MSKSRRLREALFRRGANALRKHVELPQDAYCCPVCCRAFTRNDLEAGALSLEHVPPKAQAPGARAVALTCRDCNNVGGHTVDVAALTTDRLWALTEAMFRHQGHARGEGYVEVDGHRLGIHFEMRDRVLTLRPPGVIGPAATEAAHTFWHSGSWSANGGKFRFTPNLRYDGWLGRLGSLRTAYLAAFAKYGYEYALHPRLEAVRQQLQHPAEKRLIGFWFDLDYDGYEGPAMIGFSEPAPCLLVRTNRRGVILPWVEGPAWSYPYPAPDGAEPGRLQLRDGEWVPWPTTLEMALDHAAASPLPFELTRVPGAPGEQGVA